METQLEEKTVSPGSAMKVAEFLLHLGNDSSNWGMERGQGNVPSP